jgi:mRNA-degrading endonuclease toxin of MazEF toxin-antitoxin module
MLKLVHTSLLEIAYEDDGPILILTRNEVIDRLNEIIVAPVTRTIRGLSTEVVLTTHAECLQRVR